MPSLTNKQLLLGFVVVLSVAYPFLVYYFAPTVPTFYFVIGILALLLARALLSRSRQNSTARLHSIYFVLAITAVMLIFYGWNSHIAPLFYPVVMSLAVAFLMGFSLLYPPSLIERFARIWEPDLNATGVRYTKKVTVMWMLFGLINASISLVTIILNNRALWTLYNGCISYVLMGLLMGGEYLIRCHHRKKHR